MIRLTRSQLQPIGLDIGYDSVKLLQVETYGQTLGVVAAARQTLPQEVRENPELRMPVASDMIRQMFRQGGFSGRRVVAAVPREILHVKNLRMPLIPHHELIAAVKFEAKNIFPFDTDKAHVQIITAGEVRQGLDVRQEVIVLAAKNEDVNNFLEQMHRCGAQVESLDVEACAIYRSLERFIRRREDEQEVHVIVDVGARRSHVVIGKGREISFMKPIEIGSNHLHEAISRKLEITGEEARGLRRRLIEGGDAEAADANPATAAAAKRDPVRQAVFDATRSTMEELAREIGLCLRYYSVTFRGQRPSKVRLLGGEAADPQLLGVLNGALSVPVEAGRPLFSVNHDQMDPADRRGTMSEWALALGLALKQTVGQFSPRDGKPRETSRSGVTAEVVDLDKAVEAAAASAAAGVASASSGVPTAPAPAVPAPAAAATASESNADLAASRGDLEAARA
jgi:type IV pilus assembly protein PilM